MSSECSSPPLTPCEDIRNGNQSPGSVGTPDDDVYEERFRVDRRKLEQMLQGDRGGSTEAEEFFLEVMESTRTLITWPSKLKIGAKSKKDPHIKVSGDPECVRNAKDKIMTVLDTKSNRVTLKIDVAHTEHSHVIGKGGNNIRKVMENTSCHIHFPDSNRSNQTDKSNQVSIAGQPFGVECARMKIRELLPIVFMFDLPLTGLLRIQPDQSSPVITRLQQQYNVTIAFRQQPRSYCTTVILRGTVSNSAAMKEATVLLMEHLTGNIGTVLPVSLHLEVASQHHLFMIGRGGSNMQQIMAKTGATICFPDPNTVNLARKGTIYITGSIDSVLAAREQIIGCLPLVLMFDMKEDIVCDQTLMNNLMENLDVFISVKPKPKQPSKSVIVKSIEQNSRNMYEARRLLLGLEKEEMPQQNTGSTETFTNSEGSLSAGHMLNQNALNIGTTKPLLLMSGQVSPLNSPQHITQTNQPWTLTLPGQGTFNPIMLHSSTLTCQPRSTYDNVIYSTAQCTTDLTYSQQSSPLYVNQSLAQCVKYHSKTRSPTTARSSTPAILVSQHSNCSPNRQHSPIITKSEDKSFSPRPSSPGNNAASHLPPRDISVLCTKPRNRDLQLSTQLTDSLSKSLNLQSSESGRGDNLRVLQQTGSALSRSFSLRCRNGLGCSHSGAGLSRSQTNLRQFSSQNGLSNSQLGLDLATQHSRSQSSINADVSLEKTNLSSDLLKPPPGISQLPNGGVNSANVGAALADYERKKVMASKAIKEEPDGETRNPTDYWSGLGFSRSMPDSVIRDRLKQTGVRYDGSNMATTYEQQEEDGDPWKDSKMPNRTDQVPSNVLRKFDHYGLNSSLSSSNNMDNVTTNGTAWVNNNNNSKPSQEKSDMAELFVKLGLERYIDLFQQQEIDLATFTTLNDQDLKELGISTFGARRKMLLAIADLLKSRQKYFSPTPGSNNPFRQTSASGGPFPLTRHHDIISQSGRW